MSNVDFGEGQNTGGFSRPYQNPESKGMVGLLIKWGVAKDAKIANIILLVIALAFFGISIYLAVAFLIPPRAPVGNSADVTNPLRDRANQVQPVTNN
jgi:hypothetical protein